MMNLAHVKPGDDADVFGVAFFHQLPKFVALQKRGLFLAVQSGVGEGADASASHLYHVGVEFFQHGDFQIHIHAAVNVPQIVLDHAKFVIHPPFHKTPP